jgi:hypothetical protein
MEGEEFPFAATLGEASEVSRDYLVEIACVRDIDTICRAFDYYYAERKRQ